MKENQRQENITFAQIDIQKASMRDKLQELESTSFFQQILQTEARMKELEQQIRNNEKEKESWRIQNEFVQKKVSELEKERISMQSNLNKRNKQLR